MAIALRGDAPVDPPIAEASVWLAEAILQLNAVRSARLALFSGGVAGAQSDRGDQKAADSEIRRGDMAEQALALSGRAAEFHRLEGDERKAISRQSRLMNRLDYLILEGLRRW